MVLRKLGGVFLFVILTYDVNAKRDSKVMKVCRRYLTHQQRSVFEGVITIAKLKKLKKELEKIIDVKLDSICIYEFESLKYTSKEKIGVNNYEDNIL